MSLASFAFGSNDVVETSIAPSIAELTISATSTNAIASNRTISSIRSTPSAAAAAITAIAVGYLIFAHAAAHRTARFLDRVRDAPAEITLAALILVIMIVIATKAWTGRGTPLRGGLPSGHAALAFAGWMAATYVASDPHRFLISSITFIMALLVAQTRVESGVHSALEVLYGGAVGALVTLVVFQVLS